MRDDLKSLRITHKELRDLTNLPVDNQLPIITDSLYQLGKLLLVKVQGSEGATAVFISSSVLIFTYLLFDWLVKELVAWITLPSWILLILTLVWLGSVSQGVLYLWWKYKTHFLKKNMTSSLKVLLNDVSRYNSVIYAININDQIEAAGNPAVGIQNRDKVIRSLKFTKLDLVRALKTERILRENKAFILTNSGLFIHNLSSLSTIEVSEKAAEHDRLLNEALQIAMDVKQEMKKLQD
ncbi:hypothetical protein [Cylindrospermopsis raciborskii]|uniref:Uncharacterized protein n=1 Tax=Cylindrospermopsis raciborskii CENA302 TaxID=1170768 RepID=A0A9Q5QVY7_9CYAN|nr:hypothetical protein [Cylindrospermopsis raciborskii]NLQ06345.1 hypothetical protein [Cylindrospermopsis raciborskii MVCC19]OHY35430.1 hypothetical protein BCV64_03430 [Cylindrospermopsis raciborskii MVCC14]OPH09443.1 hypothetical protein CENA302_11135 [Cylindrospermopsis raciborskii CENA302]